MSTQLRPLYRKAIDYITFIKLDAPDFAPGDNLTWETAIERLRRYLSEVREAEKSGVALRWLELCSQDVHKAENLFAHKQDSDARKALDTARTYLMNASARRAMDAKFIGGENGGMQDLDSGFPS